MKQNSIIMKVDLDHLLRFVPRHRIVVDDPATYDQAIRKHPFYKEMTDLIVAMIKNHADSNRKILEIGAGTGTLTEKVIKISYSQYSVIEPEKDAFSYLKNKFSKLRGSRHKLVNKDFLAIRGTKTFDIIFSSFVDHHISFKKKPVYYKKIFNLLKPKGIYIAGEELIRDFVGEGERKKALKEYHGYIIQEVIQRGDFDMAEIELRALRNGLDKFDEYKTSLTHYIQTISATGFRIRKCQELGSKKSGGGIYVVVAAK